jgi:hypothetical protein
MSLEGDSPTSGQTRASSEEPTDSSTMSSPRPARKRTIDEMYTSKSGATGLSKKTSVNQRPNTAPEQSQKSLQSSQFEQHGFPKDLPNPAARSFGSTIATLSTQASDVSTAITAPDTPQIFVSQLQALHAQLDRQYDEYVEELQDRDHKAQLEPFDWDELEEAYARDMEPAIRDEQEIQMELANCYKVCSNKTSVQCSC